MKKSLATKVAAGLFTAGLATSFIAQTALAAETSQPAPGTVSDAKITVSLPAKASFALNPAGATVAGSAGADLFAGGGVKTAGTASSASKYASQVATPNFFLANQSEFDVKIDVSIIASAKNGTKVYGQYDLSKFPNVASTQTVPVAVSGFYGAVTANTLGKIATSSIGTEKAAALWVNFLNKTPVLDAALADVAAYTAPASTATLLPRVVPKAFTAANYADSSGSYISTTADYTAWRDKVLKNTTDATVKAYLPELTAGATNIPALTVINAGIAKFATAANYIPGEFTTAPAAAGTDFGVYKSYTSAAPTTAIFATAQSANGSYKALDLSNDAAIAAISPDQSFRIINDVHSTDFTAVLKQGVLSSGKYATDVNGGWTAFTIGGTINSEATWTAGDINLYFVYNTAPLTAYQSGSTFNFATTTANNNLINSNYGLTTTAATNVANRYARKNTSTFASIFKLSLSNPGATQFPITGLPTTAYTAASVPTSAVTYTRIVTNTALAASESKPVKFSVVTVASGKTTSTQINVEALTAATITAPLAGTVNLTATYLGLVSATKVPSFSFETTQFAASKLNTTKSALGAASAAAINKKTIRIEYPVIEAGATAVTYATADFQVLVVD